MPRGFLLFRLLWLLTLLPAVVLADAPATQPTPIVQLTAQPDRFLDHDNHFGNMLLRELQRQAVLIAARDELGLGTRDIVLREPFVAHGTNGATTVLFESRVWKNDQAQICLSRFDGTQPVDAYSLADLQVDSPKNVGQQWVSFKVARGPTIDYADFATKCEEASRGSYLKALLVEKVLGGYTANPIPWVAVGTAAPADPMALERLNSFDVFSQYLAIRLLHRQIRSSGASAERVGALVRGYANLGVLTHDQWSRGNKVFLARALLYAQRLVVHENQSAASLNVRAYARAFTGLHAAALADLDDAAAKPEGAKPSAWVALVRGYCRFDPDPLEEVIAAGPWNYRQVASFLDARVSADNFPAIDFKLAIDRALTSYPGIFVLAPDSPDGGDANNPKPSDAMINQLPVLMHDVLKNAELPSSASYAVRQLKPGDDSFRIIASLRDRLISATTKTPLETNEPSFGVLADLVEEQEMLAILHRAQSSRANGVGTGDVHRLADNASPILKGHPWGPYVDALAVETNGEDPRLTKLVAKIKDRDPGPWVDDAMNHIDNMPNDAVNLANALRERARLTADSLVDDFTYSGDPVYLARLLKTSPYSATLMQAWLRSMPAVRINREPKMYDSTIQRVEEDFANRPDVMVAASDWCNTRGDFDRSLKLLQKTDQIEPSVDVCTRLSRLDRRLGNREQSISEMMRAVKLANDPNQTCNVYQQLAVDLIEDHRYDEALSCVQLSSDTPNSRSWQLMARCYEAMGQYDSADECLRQQVTADPPSISQHYMWAKRLGRKDLKEIRRKAQLTFAQPTEFMPEFFMSMAEDQEHKAYDTLRRYRGSMDDAYEFAQLAILAKQQHEDASLTDALNAMQSATNDSFGTAFKSLAQSKDIAVGIIAFDQWVGRQLYDEDAVDWYSLAGRYLLAMGHAPEGKAYLIRAVRQPAHEAQDYYLAWRELLKIGENPQKLMLSPATAQ
jgi:tetratricopeptide (TPR) repeat protein